ncbi:fused vitamin K epoxide reductase/thioredoxin [Bdellovibrio bacteriovorus]|uniref:Fused vitamin K epoxide reductase/thioredoxin n=1 Tax=Bdellovibrio bacteriovorus TaxID=959 RepID=A0A150WJ71_BDEBC|nr:DsbA family protein [Bdellovibrio bacteriovorus]KYG63837.1 fused vitamin K epoxide reductase/thioredoxin [Bdellovibrio bacteriovorus]
MKNNAKNSFLLVALISTLLALGVFGYLSTHYYELKFGAPTEGSMCNINDVMNCDAVAASSFSALFGIPMALWGLATNLVLLYFLLVTRFNLVQDKEKASRYTLMLSGITLIASIVMGLISTQMANLCIFCITSYVLSLITFICVLLGAYEVSVSNLMNDFKDIFVTERWVLGFAIAIPVIAFLGNIMFLESHGYSKIAKISEEKIAYWNVATVQTFDPAAGLILQKGTGEPVMTIVEFADFRCPHCKHAAPGLHAFTKSRPDVRLQFKPFPLDGTCNQAIQGGDGISCGIAAAVMCAEQQSKKGWETHDFFFDTQETVLRTPNLDQNLQAASEKLGLNLDELKKCVQDPAMQESIRKMAKEGATAQIRGTPTIFVNNKLLEGGHLVPVLEAAYQSLKK